MTNQRINDVDTITTISGTDRILVNTDIVNNVLEQIEKDDFIADIISTDANNLIEVGTDNKLFSELPATVTTQGNTFNGNSQLIQTTSTGKYPALDGNLITNITADLPNASTANMPTLANNTTDANNDIDFSAGFCYDLSTEIKITNTAFTKRLDAAFSEGTNQGGLFSGSKANSTEYHCFAISKADGSSDFGFSTSGTASDIPSGFINKRRLGSIFTGPSGNIIDFVQYGDDVRFKKPILDVYVTNLGTTRVNYTLTVPSGKPIKANFTTLVSESSSNGAQVYLCSPECADLPPSNSTSPGITLGNVVGMSDYGLMGVGDVEIYTNSARQISARALNNNTELRIFTNGYKDLRGKN